MKRAFIIHCWGGSPNEFWYPWLKKELESKGWTVIVPKMPETNKPNIVKWTAAVKRVVKTVDKDTYFIGHSIGCQTIIRYLASQKKQCGGAVFVAGWFTLANLKPKELPIAKPWQYEPIDFVMAKKNMKQSVAILGAADALVPLKPNKDVFMKVLGSKVIVEKGKGHFDDEAGKERPLAAVKELVAMARNT